MRGKGERVGESVMAEVWPDLFAFSLQRENMTEGAVLKTHVGMVRACVHTRRQHKRHGEIGREEETDKIKRQTDRQTDRDGDVKD